MNQMRLTQTAVEKAAYSKSNKAADFRWDADVKGFGLRVYPSGEKRFIVTYRNNAGIKRFHKIGSASVLSVEKARDRAKILLASVLQGADPQAEREHQREAATVADLCSRYLSDHAEPKKRASSVKQDGRMIETRIKPELGRMKVHGVTRAEIDKLHQSLKATPYEANRALALLSKMFNLAEKWGLRSDGTNPCRHVERFRERKRERFLSDEEWGRFGKALADAERDETETQYTIAAFRLLAFTGMRLGEVLSLCWEWVDHERNVIRLPESKTGAKHVPLSAPALAVLKKLDRIEDNPFVIAGDRKQGLVNLHHAWNRIRSAAKLDDVRIHDLRHSFASVGAASNMSLPIIGKMLGHTHAATTARYAHLAADPVHRAMGTVANRIKAAMAGKSAEIVELRSAKRRKTR